MAASGQQRRIKVEDGVTVIPAVATSASLRNELEWLKHLEFIQRADLRFHGHHTFIFVKNPGGNTQGH